MFGQQDLRPQCTSATDRVYFLLFRGLSKEAVDLKKGDLILDEKTGQIMEVLEAKHTSMAQSKGLVQADLSYLLKGGKVTKRFRSNEDVEIAEIEHKKMKYTGKSEDGIKYVFENVDDEDEIHEVDSKVLSESAAAYMMYCDEKSPISLSFHEEKLLKVKLPHKLVCEVEANDSHCLLTNGRQIKGVPKHVGAGDKILVNIDTDVFVQKMH